MIEGVIHLGSGLTFDPKTGEMVVTQAPAFGEPLNPLEQAVEEAAARKTESTHAEATAPAHRFRDVCLPMPLGLEEALREESALVFGEAEEGQGEGPSGDLAHYIRTVLWHWVELARKDCERMGLEAPELPAAMAGSYRPSLGDLGKTLALPALAPIETTEDGKPVKLLTVSLQEQLILALETETEAVRPQLETGGEELTMPRLVVALLYKLAAGLAEQRAVQGELLALSTQTRVEKQMDSKSAPSPEPELAAPDTPRVSGRYRAPEDLPHPELGYQASANRPKKQANLRLTAEFLRRVDAAAERAGKTRTDWLTELIAEKLEAEPR